MTNLSLYVYFVGGGSNGNLTLYRVADDTWQETTVTYNTRPAIGAEILSVSVPTAVGFVIFSGQALADYINQESAYTGAGDPTAGDDWASFAIQITGCSATNNVVIMYAKDKTGVPAEQLPRMSPFGPNAVTLTFFRAADPAVNWPLIAAGLLVTALLAGVGVYRWRLSRA
jgi:hypothetical protein